MLLKILAGIGVFYIALTAFVMVCIIIAPKEEEPEPIDVTRLTIDEIKEE